MTAAPPPTVPPGLRIEPAWAVPSPSLWLPPAMQKRRALVPETSHTLKLIYFKGRLFTGPDRQWYGGIRRCHYNVDIDTPGRDGMTARDHIHLYLTGVLERVSGGTWVYQDSDERWSTTILEEWPEFQHTVARWDRFWARKR